MASQLVPFAASLIAGPNASAPPSARIIVVGVVKVPEGAPFSDGHGMARSYRAMFGFLPPNSTSNPLDLTPASGPIVRELLGETPVPVHRVVKVARSVAQGICEAAIEENADLILLHWKGFASKKHGAMFGEITDEVLANAPCNCLLYRPGQAEEIHRILIAVRGGPAAELALATGVTLAVRKDAEVTLLHAVPAAKVMSATHAAEASVAASAGGAAKQVLLPPDARRRGDEPFIDLMARAATLSERLHIPIQTSLTSSREIGGVIAEEAKEHDLVILGVPDKRNNSANGLGQTIKSLGDQVEKTLLLIKAPGEIDLQDYRRRVDINSEGSNLALEHWFVENTYHSAELSSVENWLSLKESRGAYLSVVLPTHNDAHRIFPMLKGLRQALQEHAPIADEIIVVDAASQDNTPQIAAEMGFTVLPIRRSGQNNTPVSPHELLAQALNLARGNILVWLDPKAGKLHPGSVTALTPPLMSESAIKLVKPFWPAADESASAESEESGPSARFSTLQASDLLAMRVDKLAALPLHAWFRAFYPTLGAVVDPTSRVFAARASLLRELLPTLQKQADQLNGDGASLHFETAGLSFYAGLLLETARCYGPRSIAQVEMSNHNRRSRPRFANTDLRQLRPAMELLNVFSLYKDELTDAPALRQLQCRIGEAMR